MEVRPGLRPPEFHHDQGPGVLQAANRGDADEERQARLNGWAARLRSIEAEKPIEVGEY